MVNQAGTVIHTRRYLEMYLGRSHQHWIDEVLNIQYHCVSSHSKSNPELLMDVAELLNAAPKDITFYNSSAQSNSKFQQMIEAGAYESAAVALIGSEARYMVSRGIDGSSLASVILPGMDMDVSVRAASFELALIGAYLGAVFSMCSGVAPPPGRCREHGQRAH